MASSDAARHHTTPHLPPADRRPIRLLICCEFPTLFGGEHSMLATLPRIREAGFDVAVAAPAGGDLADALAERRIRHICLELRDNHGRKLPRPQIDARLAALLRRQQPAVVHANSLTMGRYLGPVARQLGYPSVGHLRDIIKLSGAAIGDLNQHTRLLAVSHATRRYHTAAGLDAERTRVLYNGIDATDFCPRAPTLWLHQELGLAADVQLAAAIGQVSLRKGLDVTLAAAERLAQRHPRLHLLIIGRRYAEKEETRRLEQSLRATAEQGPLCGRVHFLGQRHDVRHILTELTLLVHAARQEPLGRVLLEAGASGCAIAATNVGGTTEIFPLGTDSAHLVEPDDPSALAAAVDRLLSDDRLREQTGQRARARMVSAFGIEAAAAGLIGVYRDVVEAQ